MEPVVHIGTWTNWSHGKVSGLTLTLTPANGAFLVAFIALFVSFVGTSLFRITCFAFHHVFSTTEPQDEVYHQRQAILRNSANGPQAFFSLFGMLWSRRNAKKNIIGRIVPTLTHVTLFMAAFAVAGIFSSRITTMAGDEVLVRSDRTRPIARNLTDDEYLNIIPHAADEWNYCSRYALDCYTNGSSRATSNCQRYVKQQLARTIDRNAPCPFNDDLCRTKNGNIKIDTGYLDSHEDLGLNAPPEHRVRVRHTMQCAPLQTQGYTERRNATSSGYPVLHALYSYGSQLDYVGQNESHPVLKYTHIEPVETKQLFAALHPAGPSVGRYKLLSFGSPSGAYQGESPSTWMPIQDLKRNDSDTVILFLTPTDLWYSGEVEDPWFSAHQPWREYVAGGVRGFSYAADEPASPLACTSNIQICFPPFSDKSQCSDQQGIIDLAGSSSFSPSSGKWTDAQKNISEIYREMATDLNVFMPVRALGGELIKASASAAQSLQRQLPADAWQEEIINMSGIILTKLQQNMVTYATGPADPRIDKILWTAARNEQQVYFTQNMKIRSTHANFSVVALVIIMGVGTLILLTEALLECLYVRLLWRGRDYHQYKRLEWSLNGTLQLQRLAHENAGYGPWTDCDEEIPRLEGDAKLGTLDLSDPKRPRLVPAAQYSPVYNETVMFPEKRPETASDGRTISVDG